MNSGKIPMAPMGLNERQAIEIDFWRTSEKESPEADSPEVLISKLGEAGILLDCIKQYAGEFQLAGTILELGGGQGWGSCLVKRLHPTAKIFTSDISKWAVASLPKWEHVFRANVDQSFACSSYEIPLPSNSVDLVFAFAAAHHFGAHRKTLTEVKRVLRPGGRCLYLNEPVCPRPFYRTAVWRVNTEASGSTGRCDCHEQAAGNRKGVGIPVPGPLLPASDRARRIPDPVFRCSAIDPAVGQTISEHGKFCIHEGNG